MVGTVGTLYGHDCSKARLYNLYSYSMSQTHTHTTTSTSHS